MLRSMTITSPAGDSVTARLATPPHPSRVGILLAHGAGVGHDHEWMTSMRDRLADRGHPTMTFNYPYTEAGRKRPDRPERMLAVHEAALEHLLPLVAGVVLAGKSMGGRLGSHVAADLGRRVAGLVYYGYPLVPMGKSQPRLTEHLTRIDVPQVFFAGTRDRLCPIAVVEPLVASLPDAELIVVEQGDHSFRVPKSAGVTGDDVHDRLADDTAAWIARRITDDLPGEESTDRP